MTGLFDAGFLWMGLGWLCFMAFTLLTIVLLFPQPSPSKLQSQERQEELLHKANPEEPSTANDSSR